jgi:hypothetical protein
MPKITVPAITLTSIGSGRKFTLNKIGIPALLIFHGRSTVEASEKINGPVRERYPDATRLLVATIMDLHIAPRLLRGVVEAFIRGAYEDGVKKLPKGWKASDYLVLFPDWDGSLTKAFAFKDTDHIAAVAVLDRQGNVAGAYQGKDYVAQTMAFLAQISDEIDKDGSKA